MNGPRSAIVFFSYPDADDEKEDAVRQQTLARGTDEILANVPGLRVMQSNNLSCTLSVVGNSESISHLKSFVTDRALGAIELEVFEKPAFRVG
jgi:hypothetical protein